MRGTVFYTQISVPHNIQFSAYVDLVEFFKNQRSITQVKEVKGAIALVVGGGVSSVKYSDCPLPGTHEFAAGWLAHEAMMTVAQKFDQPVAWLEGEIYDAQIPNGKGDFVVYPARRSRDGKPVVVVNPDGTFLPRGPAERTRYQEHRDAAEVKPLRQIASLDEIEGNIRAHLDRIGKDLGENIARLAPKPPFDEGGQITGPGVP